MKVMQICLSDNCYVLCLSFKGTSYFVTAMELKFDPEVTSICTSSSVSILNLNCE